MNKLIALIKNPVLYAVIMVFTMVLLSFTSTENTPEGYTGAPADDKDCSSCHKAKAKDVDGIFSCNIPSEAYTPLETYTIKLKLKGKPESSKFGFQVSPQTSKGKMAGKLIVTDPVQTRLANPKYLNQTAKGVDGTCEKTWLFNWTAPAKGTGTVTFYGSFLIGGKPELVYNSSLIIKEKT